MSVKVAINGLGRIGRCIIRAVEELGRKDVEIVALNGPAPAETHVHLLKYDSIHGKFPGKVSSEAGKLVINGKSITLTHERDPSKIDWKKLGADIVLECTGKFTKAEDAGIHLKSGAKKVLVSAPCSGADSMIVFGVNNSDLKPDHKIISVGSCTTNGLAPVIKVLNEKFGIEAGHMTTIHSYTNDQNIMDGSHKDLRRARSAATSMIPTSTGAASSLGKIFPELKGKIDGISIRVPTPNVSMIDLSFTVKKPISKDAINSEMEKAANGELKGILSYSKEQLVSVDFVHDPHSSIFDSTQTNVVDGKIGRVAAWYDNEWGFSIRMLDVAALAGK